MEMKSSGARRTATATMAMLLVAGGLLAGCSSSDGGSDPAPSNTTATSEGGQSAPALTDEQVVTQDVTQTTCENGPGSVSATGTVKNSATEVRDLVIVVNWTSADGTTVLATTPVTLKQVAAGESREYAAKNEVEGADSALCTVQARAGVLK